MRQGENNEYQKVMEGLQGREITPDDYDLLMSLEQKAHINLGNFLAIAVREESSDQTVIFSCDPCVNCDEDDDELGEKIILKSCKHFMHFKCLEETFEKGENKC